MLAVEQTAPVSAPCTWAEVERGKVHPQSFTVPNMTKRIASAGDLWADMLRHKKSLTKAIAKLRQIDPRI
jgi:bifunctional non-homologous end joining protein LigD